MIHSYPKIYGVILASGYSRRMGEQKLLLPLGQGTIFDQVIKTVHQSHLSGIYTVIPSESKGRREISTKHDVDQVFNDKPYLGMGYSLALGIHSLPKNTDAAVILLADQPEIHPADINAVYQQFCNQDRSEKVIIRTYYQNQIKGHPILFSKHFFSELKNLTGDVGGKHTLHKHSHYVKDIQSHHDYPEDIDTPTDYNMLISK